MAIDVQVMLLMPTCLTKYHGEMEYDDQALLHFKCGLFAFEAETRFLTIQPSALLPLVFLQSVATPNLCFLSLPILVVDPEYVLTVAPEDLAAIELPAEREPRIGDDVLCLAIITIHPASETTADLLAPVVINRHNSKAIQAISLERNYTHQAPLRAMTKEPVCS